MEIQLENTRGEYREGYYVCSLMKRNWLAQMEMLKEIDIICRRHGLRWYAAWGTCLGAARHKGFIPWDDDIDIEMPRKDLELFKRYARQELPGTMLEVDCVQDNVDTIFTKVLSHRYKYCLDQAYLDRFHGCPYQVAIDIMCIDKIPDDPDEAAYTSSLAMSAYGIGWQWDKLDEKTREEQFESLLQITHVPCPTGRAPKQHCMYLAETLSAMYMDEDCEYSGTIYYYDRNKNRKIRTEMLSEQIWIPFEQTQVSVMKDYHVYLETMFGSNYMTPIRWNQHSFLEEAIGNLRSDLEGYGQKLLPQFDLAKCPEEEG